MTRTEEMGKAFAQWFKEHIADVLNNGVILVWKDAVKWADEHPVNQWKDINKEQPPKDELPFLISYDDYGDFVGKETCFWSEGAYRLCSNGRSFKELEPWYHITHWMSIPELPESKRS